MTVIVSIAATQTTPVTVARCAAGRHSLWLQTSLNFGEHRVRQATATNISKSKGAVALMPKLCVLSKSATTVPWSGRTK